MAFASALGNRLWRDMCLALGGTRCSMDAGQSLESACNSSYSCLGVENFAMHVEYNGKAEATHSSKS